MAGRVAEVSQTSSLLGFVHRRRRGAELFLLVLALAVGVGAYAAVGLGVEGEIPADILGVRRVAGRPDHRGPRRRTPHRAVRRPGAAAGRGRAERARPGGDPPAGPGLRGRRPDGRVRPEAADLDDPGGRAVRGHPGLPARPPGPAAGHLHRRPGGDRAAAAADGPRPGHHHQRRPDLDPGRRVQLPARRGREGAARDRLRRLSGAPPRRPRARRAPRALRRPPPRPGPRPDPGDVADQPRHPRLPARPRLEPAVLRPVPGHALRLHRAAGVAGGRRRPVHRRRAARLAALHPRAGPGGHLAGPLRPLRRGHRRPGLPARRGDVRDGLGRADRPRLR